MKRHRLAAAVLTVLTLGGLLWLLPVNESDAPPSAVIGESPERSQRHQASPSEPKETLPEQKTVTHASPAIVSQTTPMQARRARVEVVLTTEDGTEYNGPWLASLRPAGGRLGNATYVRSTAGPVGFDAVEGTYQVQAWLPANALASAIKWVQVAGGAAQSLRLRIEPTRFVVVLRTSLPNRRVRASFVDSAGAQSLACANEDFGTGVYAIPFDAERAPVRASVVFELRRRVTDYDLQHVQLELPPLRRGINDLGVVATHGAPVLAAGTVVDDDGAPAGDAWVSAHARGAWYDCTVRARQDGSFVVQGPPVDSLLLSASGESELLSPTVEAFPPARGIQLRMVRRCGIVGRVVLDFGAPFDVVTWCVEELTGATCYEDTLDTAGGFKHDCLAAGTVVVRARLGEVSLDVVEVDLRAGETVRLRPLDLRGKLQRFSVRVENRDGTPADGALVEFEGSRGTDDVTNDDGCVELWAARPARGGWPILVRAAGRVTQFTLTSANPSPVIRLP